MSSQTHSNRLATETSPYLLQHAHNPVDWYPWGAEVLAKAKQENKPILLSIGYSACHWCHVMAHESFEDADVARVMNELFICIKVDREERPDLDKIYQLAHQMLAQRTGGWPLTMFLTPDDHSPFFGGTYFPKEARHGLPAFPDLLRRVAAYYRDNREDVRKQNAAVHDVFNKLAPIPMPDGVSLDGGALINARHELERQYDSRYGGFGVAPKFPHPTSIERCLRHHHLHPGDKKSLNIALHSLHAMAAGGLYDQLGGGFCRYSVDEFWMIPHFEKMLYDNAQLLPLYIDASLLTGDAFARRIAEETGQWVMREMQSPEGGYYSTLDADSEGHEGTFYLWTPQEAQSLLSPEEYTVLATHYGLNRAPNFEGQAWHLHTFDEIDAVAEATGLSLQRVTVLLGNARQTLFAAREKRVRPGRDEKILTAWNGLMIKAMAYAGRFSERADFIRSAERAFDFTRATLWRDGRLLATYKDGKAHLNAYLDDYAFLLDASLALLQARWRDGDLAFAIALAETLLTHYQDPEQGGFYFTADDHERLLHRPKPAADEALPAGNGVALYALQRLGHLLGEIRYLDAAQAGLKALYGEILRYPSAHNSLLNTLEEYLSPPETLVLRGDLAAMAPWVRHCQQAYAPRRMIFAIPDTATDLPGLLAEHRPHTQVTAYLCRGHSCQAPITDLDSLEQALSQ